MSASTSTFSYPLSLYICLVWFPLFPPVLFTSLSLSLSLSLSCVHIFQLPTHANTFSHIFIPSLYILFNVPNLLITYNTVPAVHRYKLFLTYYNIIFCLFSYLHTYLGISLPLSHKPRCKSVLKHRAHSFKEKHCSLSILVAYTYLTIFLSFNPFSLSLSLSPSHDRLITIYIY